MSLATSRDKCAVCDKPTSHLYSGLEEVKYMGGTHLAHETGVCGSCFTEQYQRKYGVEPEGVAAEDDE